MLYPVFFLCGDGHELIHGRLVWGWCEPRVGGTSVFADSYAIAIAEEKQNEMEKQYWFPQPYNMKYVMQSWTEKLQHVAKEEGRSC